GPFALNGTYLKLLAALTVREVMALPVSTGTSQGAALLTGIRPISGVETHVPPTAIPGLTAWPCGETVTFQALLEIPS
ncbi:hypothetical protein AB9F46_36365, partial [Rhizobium leguminosarum]